MWLDEEKQKQMGKRVGSSAEHRSPASPWRLERQMEHHMAFLSHVSSYAQALMSPFTDLEVGLAEQGFEATCSCIICHALCQA